MTTTYSQIGVLLELQEALGLCSDIPHSKGKAEALISELQKRLTLEVRVSGSDWRHEAFPSKDAVLQMLQNSGMDTRYPIARHDDLFGQQVVFTGRRLVRELATQERKPS